VSESGQASLATFTAIISTSGRLAPAFLHLISQRTRSSLNAGYGTPECLGWHHRSLLELAGQRLRHALSGIKGQNARAGGLLKSTLHSWFVHQHGFPQSRRRTTWAMRPTRAVQSRIV
jgi:hypothetical protein